MKTQLSKPARSKARYTDQYKQEALELWRASGRSAAKVAAELGIRPPLLYRWAHAERVPDAPKAGRKPKRSLEELEAENRRLRAENAKLLEQREVLKKSLGILSEAPPRGMPRIQQMSGQYKVAWLCEALLVSRSGYYDWKQRRRSPGPRQLENIRLRERIREEFARSRQTYGSPRLAHALGCPGRRNRIARLMRLDRIFARQRSKYRAAITDSRHGGPIAPNRLHNLALRRSNQVWVSDATAVLTGQGWLHLVAVLDVFTRRVVGWAMSQILDATLVIAALRMALGHRRPAKTLILHSDRGAQFASTAYRQLLAQHGLVASMSRKGNCYDNAFIESFFSSLKYELVYHHRFATRAQARTT